MKQRPCAVKGCGHPARENPGPGREPKYCWGHAGRRARRRAGFLPPPVPRVKTKHESERIDPLIYAWTHGINRSRQIPPELARAAPVEKD